MTTGFAVGAQCFADPAEAANAYCASVAGTNSTGVVSCTAPFYSLSSGLTGSQLNLSYNLRTNGTTATTNRSVQTILYSCEAYDYSYYQPIIAVWVVALVSILCVRLIVRPFNRETY